MHTYIHTYIHTCLSELAKISKTILEKRSDACLMLGRSLSLNQWKDSN